MEVILKQDVKGLGYKDDVVNVKPGYGRNFLLPKNMASMATVSTKKTGAKIKYQTVFESVNNKPAKEIQAVKNIYKKNIASGIYFFWSERNGIVTSEKVKVFLQQNMNIDIAETSNH